MIKIFQRAVHGIDIHVVGNVITEVHLGRGVAGCEPDRVYTEVLEIVEFRSDALEIADTVVVTVCKTARINLIEHCMLPPLVAFSIDGFVLPIALERQEAKANRQPGKRQFLKHKSGTNKLLPAIAPCRRSEL